MKSSSTGMFQDADWVTSDGGAASLILLAHCGGRAIALGERIKEIPGELEHTVGHLAWVGYLASGEQGCSVAGIPTHADLSVASLGLGQVSVSVMGLAGVEPIDGWPAISCPATHGLPAPGVRSVKSEDHDGCRNSPLPELRERSVRRRAGGEDADGREPGHRR